MLKKIILLFISILLCSCMNKSYRLYNYSLRGELKELKKLVGKGYPDIDEKLGAYGSTALMLAAEKGHSEVVQYLLEKGAAIAEVNVMGETALLRACKYGMDYDTIKVLLKNGADPNFEPEEGIPILYFVVSNNSEEPDDKENKYKIAKLLLEEGADPYGFLHKGWTYLNYAVLYDNIKMYELLKSKGLEDTLFTAAAVGDLALVKRLLKGNEEQINVAYRNKTPLYVVVKNRNYEILEYLLKFDIDLEVNGFCLESVVREGDYKALKLMLDNGFSANYSNKKGYRPVHWAATLEDVSLLELLIERGADVNPVTNVHKETALMIASSRNHIDSVKLLLDNGAEPDKKDFLGATALMDACKKGNMEIVEILIESGADITLKDKDGNDLLHYAKQSGDEAFIKSIEEKLNSK